VLNYLQSVKSIAIVGATGLVGQECLSILAENKIKIPKIKLLASERSEGEKLEFGDTEIPVEKLTTESFDDVEVAFFSTPNLVTERYVPVAVKSGCLVIDDSSVYRLKSEVPLVIPEINGSVLKDFSGKIISTPNCAVTPLALLLSPLHQKWGVKRVVVSTYQSVSGAGKKAFERLSNEAASFLNGVPVEETEGLLHPFAFNCIPQIGSITADGYTSEEEKVIQEARKILGLPELKLTVTCVRVPTFFGHALNVNVEFDKNFKNVEELKECLDDFDGIRVLDKPEAAIYPTNLETTGTDICFVGRIRRDFSLTSGANFWCLADNLRKGAALNSFQILDTLYKYQNVH
jgi:aspartate-semialdehyde dehydrogenase